jgi:hypothetical protein
VRDTSRNEICLRRPSRSSRQSRWPSAPHCSCLPPAVFKRALQPGAGRSPQRGPDDHDGALGERISIVLSPATTGWRSVRADCGSAGRWHCVKMWGCAARLHQNPARTAGLQTSAELSITLGLVPDRPLFRSDDAVAHVTDAGLEMTAAAMPCRP